MLYCFQPLVSLTCFLTARVESGYDAVRLDSLNFRYRIEGDDPPWRPVRAFDDGRKVYIQMPSGLSQGEAPITRVDGALTMLDAAPVDDIGAMLGIPGDALTTVRAGHALDTHVEGMRPDFDQVVAALGPLTSPPAREDAGRVKRESRRRG